MLLTKKRSHRTTWNGKPVIIVLHYDADTKGYTMAVKEAGKYNRDIFFDPYNSHRDQALPTGIPVYNILYFVRILQSMGINFPRGMMMDEDFFDVSYDPSVVEVTEEEKEWMKEARSSFPPIIPSSMQSDWIVTKEVIST